jgi:hypothetical protein
MGGGIQTLKLIITSAGQPILTTRVPLETLDPNIYPLVRKETDIVNDRPKRNYRNTHFQTLPQHTRDGIKNYILEC